MCKTSRIVGQKGRGLLLANSSIKLALKGRGMRILIAGLTCIVARLCCGQTPIESIDIKNDTATVTVRPPTYGRAVRPVTGAPYSADQLTERSQTLADGTHITQGRRTVHLYRDSQGRTRTERPLVMPRQTEDWTPMTEVRDPIVGSTYVLDHQSKIAHRFALTEIPKKASSCLAGTLGAASPPQCSTEKLAAQNMEGLIVDGTRETRIWPIASQGNDRPMTEYD